MTDITDAEFQREERYIVVKRKHLVPEIERQLRNFLAQCCVGTVECVVVESDWPEYEQVWAMIEARCTGKPLPTVTALQAQLAERDAEIERLRNYAREVSIAFTAVSGGGSEMFTRIGDDFYADPKACRGRVESKIAAIRRHLSRSATDTLTLQESSDD
ncbi:hypothetical protein INR77_09070 [Erythrobacter sp. SCSIO 43205]|uniref:hypothetical protein n=1 Tax=Erythrobacter sp. SCSIO 43205 TaxID=2779361 RepID=UPI001CA9B6AD|nr:hypothetical protein [Erythrobacter sp. SCSIO 43205]UAB76998.1 hypothetical protein INR77_09070 [Erythrobacter sp. SCSIO 43205]